MQRNILIGNGINIQFGGYNNYSNKAILNRMFLNIQSGRYCQLMPELSIEELMGLFQNLRKVLVNIDRYRLPEEYLFLLLEIQRIKKQYCDNTTVEDIGMEDYFLALEYGLKKDDSDDFVNLVHRGLQMLLLDAIYNDGSINHIEYGEGFQKYISLFDNVFTINYDSNLERYSSSVKHLHGDFATLAPEYDENSDYSRNNPTKCMSKTMLHDFAHVYSNTIMSWYWLEKYGDWSGKESIYGVDLFRKICGKLEIVGISPCNDNHLFLMIDHSDITSIIYYYYSEDDREFIKSKIHKPITFKQVNKLWEQISSK